MPKLRIASRKRSPQTVRGRDTCPEHPPLNIHNLIHTPLNLHLNEKSRGGGGAQAAHARVWGGGGAYEVAAGVPLDIYIPCSHQLRGGDHIVFLAAEHFAITLNAENHRATAELGNGRNTVSRVLCRKRETHWVLRQTVTR